MITVPSTIQAANNHKLKLQETKSKIDKYFSARRQLPGKPGANINSEKGNDSGLVIPSHLRANHLEPPGHEGKGAEQRSEAAASLKSTPNNLKAIPKIISHTESRTITANRPASQSKIHLKKNNVNEKNNK